MKPACPPARLPTLFLGLHLKLLLKTFSPKKLFSKKIVVN
jgi:hypothetical protein